MGLADNMVPAIRGRYDGMDVERVIDAWNRGMAGEITSKEWENKGSQVVASYIEGLDAEPWHDVDRYPWIATLETNAATIRDELHRVCSAELPAGLAWVPAGGGDAEAYGPGWRKFVLQDREWNATACDLFRKTRELIDECVAPTVEVLFARQKGNSGVKPHTDNSNFFVTAHLALEVPGENCWIRVGNEKRQWLQDRALVFDSSFVHETRNDASADRTVLLVRFWHPQLTQVERDALDFIFRALDDPSILDEPYKPPPVVGSGAESFESETSVPVSEPLLGERKDSVPAKPLGAAEEAERLDGFLADLKAEGLLPGVKTEEEVMAQGPKNREGRRKASKARKKASRQGTGKKR